MKILLLKPRPHKNSINLQSFMICEPLELEYAAAILKMQGHETVICDMVLERLSLKRILKNGNYDAVGMTAYINHVAIIKNYAKIIKQFNKNIITFVAGVHCEVIPEDFVSDSIDYILHRNAIREINKIFDGESIVKGIIGKVDGVSCPIDKDYTLLYPLRDKTKKYRDNYNYIYHDKCATLKTSYGCPYKCEFCFCTQISPFYVRPIDDVIEEIKTIEESNIFIVDDNFLFDKSRINEFVKKLKENNIEKHYIAFARADFIAENEPLIEMLSQNGFDALFVGIESFKAGELDDFNKRTSVNINIKAVRILEKHGIQCYSGLITGMDWDKKDFDELIAYLNTFEHPMVNIQPITPMPGTPLFEKQKHLITVSRHKYEIWDMAHLVFTPTKMSRRRYYYHILRAYLKTAASKRNRRYIKKKYGTKIYKRVRHGAFKIAMQYIKLIIKP